MSGVVICESERDNANSNNFLVQFARSAVCQSHGLLLEKTETSPVKRAYYSFQKIADGLTENPMREFLSAKEAITYAEEYYMPGNDNRYEIRAFNLLKQAVSECARYI